MFIKIKTLGMINKHIPSLKKLFKDCEVDYDLMTANPCFILYICTKK